MVVAVIVVVGVVGSATTLTVVVVADPSLVVVGVKTFTVGSGVDAVELAGCDEAGGTGSMVVPPHPVRVRTSSDTGRRRRLKIGTCPRLPRIGLQTGSNLS